MKVILRSSFLPSLLGIAHPAVAEAPPILGRGYAGNVRIGMLAGEVKVRRRDLSCNIENGVVTAIRVHSRRYKTEAGIGVGDSLVALANRYRIRWSDEHVAEVDELGMKFQIPGDRIVSIDIVRADTVEAEEHKL